MTTKARILADSISPEGVRLTTFEVTFPRIILAEVNTHRMLSRNSASSRAIPVEKMLDRVMENPYIPSDWGKNRKGMQAEEQLPEELQALARKEWLLARDKAVEQAQALLDIGLHKQLTNRLLEPFMWHTAILTATEWDNFFHLRNHPAAHPDFRLLAWAMQHLYEKADPERLRHGEWHLPLIDSDDWETHQNEDALASRFDLVKASVGRCARVSYLTHDGKRDIQADIDLHDRLLSSGHLSPFEHVARPERAADRQMDGFSVRRKTLPHETFGKMRVFDAFYGNFRGWVQYRKTIPNEHDILGAR